VCAPTNQKPIFGLLSIFFSYFVKDGFRIKEKVALVFLILALLLTLVTFGVYTFSQSSFLEVEAEQHWETYGVVGTCIHGSHNLFVADADGDGIMEVITGGAMYQIINGSRLTIEAPLKIWNWNGQNLTLEKSHKWSGNIECVHAGDADGDGLIEIITAGSVINSTGNYSSLRVWNWKGEELTLKASYEGTYADSIFVSDVDKNGTPEIITVRRTYSGDWSGSQLGVWHLQGNTLTLQGAAQWFVANVTSANSVYAYDLNNDGQIEIITAGYANELENSSGQLRIWHWNGEELSLKASEEWSLVGGVYGLTIAGGVQGNTMVNNVKVGDVDCDGIPEIITGGFAYDGEKVTAQLRIWMWDGKTLLLEKSKEWATDYLNEVKCISLNDVDGDSRIEIVTSGIVAAYGSFATNETSPNNAQLRIWSWDGTTLALKQSQDWTIGDGVCAWNVGTGDLDNDGTVEIVTVGCMGMNKLCDPDMRIWSIATPLPIEFMIAVVASVAVIVLASAYFFAKKSLK
jgi:hypothetical protein